MPFTIALCDDDAEQLKYLHHILLTWAKERDVDVRIAVYDCGEQFLFEYPKHPCDLLLLDIEMGRLNGMELAKKLRGEGDMLPIVFVTGFSEYMSEGYDVEALHYLLKPIETEKLYEVLDKSVSRKKAGAEEVLVKTGESTTHIPAERIACIEAFGRRSQLTLADGSLILAEQNIGQFEHLQGFLHCHRSYLVNLRYVRSIGKTSVLLDTGGEIPLSRRQAQEVNRQFIRQYLRQDIVCYQGETET